MNTASRDSEYSVNTDPEYAGPLRPSKLGWEIGLRGDQPFIRPGGPYLMIEQFESMYGPLRSWVDHGDVQQDIWQQGRVTTSLFISDRLVEERYDLGQR